MSEKADPKISLPEVILIGLFLAMLDVIDLIPFAGDITDIFAAPLIFYYFIKNINGVAYIVSLILDAIPFLQELPTRSIVWWGTVAFDYFAPKKLEAIVEKTGELGEGGGGGIPGGELGEGAAEVGTAAETGTATEGVNAVEGRTKPGVEEVQGAEGETGKDTSTGGEDVKKPNADEMAAEAEASPMEKLQEKLEGESNVIEFPRSSDEDESEGEEGEEEEEAA